MVPYNGLLSRCLTITTVLPLWSQERHYQSLGMAATDSSRMQRSNKSACLLNPAVPTCTAPLTIDLQPSLQTSPLPCLPHIFSFSLHTLDSSLRNLSMASYQADRLKEKGNVAFRNASFPEAEDFYTQAIQKYSNNPLIFTNRANARLKLQRWEGAVNDCLKSIEITGPNGQNHKAFYFLAQAQLALHHPHEALSSALTAYEQVRSPAPNAKIGPKDLETFSGFVLRCKKAKFAVRDRERLRREGDLGAELEESLEAQKQRELDLVSAQLERVELGQVEASVCSC